MGNMTPLRNSNLTSTAAYEKSISSNIFKKKSLGIHCYKTQGQEHPKGENLFFTFNTDGKSRKSE